MAFFEVPPRPRQSALAKRITAQTAFVEALYLPHAAIPGLKARAAPAGRAKGPGTQSRAERRRAASGLATMVWPLEPMDLSRERPVGLAALYCLTGRTGR